MRQHRPQLCSKFTFVISVVLNAGLAVRFYIAPSLCLSQNGCVPGAFAIPETRIPRRGASAATLAKEPGEYCGKHCRPSSLHTHSSCLQLSAKTKAIYIKEENQ